MLIFFIFVTLQLLLGAASLAQGFAWNRMVRRRLSAPLRGYSPRVALFCPCKGAERGLEENLHAITHFDYPDYEVFFAVADERDSSCEVIRQVMRTPPREMHLIVAGSPRDRSEKVNNLCAAVERAGNRFDVLVFTDSDLLLDPGWLRRLVAPLEDSHIGATTTFRWLIPGHGDVASALASAWNAAIVTLLGEHNRNFCWGGGTAIRRNTFEEIRVMEAWRGALSDDYALTAALRRAGRPILFVPECLAPTPFSASFAGLLEFTNRQVLITRIYSPRMWLIAALSHLLYCITIFYAILILMVRAVDFRSALPWTLGLLPALLITGLAMAKGFIRIRTARELLPGWRAEFRRSMAACMLLTPLVSFLYAWNSIVAACTRRLTWRGIHYELISPSQTRILP